jgi:hypothetical protein
MSSNTKNGAYKMLPAQKVAVTRITRVITLEAIDNLKDKIGGIFTILKSTHFAKEQHYNYSYLASIIPEARYQLVIANNMWLYAPPASPGAYAVAALNAGISAAH